jgi:hypothetical protein
MWLESTLGKATSACAVEAKVQAATAARVKTERNVIGSDLPAQPLYREPGAVEGYALAKKSCILICQVR